MEPGTHQKMSTRVTERLEIAGAANPALAGWGLTQRLRRGYVRNGKGHREGAV